MYTASTRMKFCDVGTESLCGIYMKCRYRRPRGQRCGSAVAPMMGLQVWIPSGTCLPVVSVVCCG